MEFSLLEGRILSVPKNIRVSGWEEALGRAGGRLIRGIR